MDKKIFEVKLTRGNILTEKEVKEALSRYLTWKGYHKGQFEIKEMIKRKDEYCKCENRDKGHSAGTLLDDTELIICNKCRKVVRINGKKT